MIIGLTGKNASGKGVTAEYLKQKGFVYFSLSDELREEAKERGIEPIRENLIKLGNELREKFGPGYLASRINKKIAESNDENFVVDSIRSPGEIYELRKNSNFMLLGIDAPVELRFDRAVSRGRHGDAKTLHEFIEMEERENFNKSSNQQLDRCLQMADRIVSNDGHLDRLHERIDSLVSGEKE